MMKAIATFNGAQCSTALLVHRSQRFLTMVLSLIVLLVLSVRSVQAYDPTLPAPTVVQLIDENGVNLTDGTQKNILGTVSVGQPGKGGLTYSVGAEQDWMSSIQHVSTLPPAYTVTLMGQPEVFGGGIGYPGNNGGTLTQSGSTYTYTRRDGTVAVFVASGYTCSGVCTDGLLSTVTYPSGEVLTFTRRTPTAAAYGFSSINSSLGYQLKINYQCNNSSLSCYNVIDNVIAINNAFDYCDPSANSCTGLTHSWPTLTLSYSGTSPNSTVQVTDAVGNVITGAYSQTQVGTTVYWTLRVTKPSGTYREYAGNFCLGCPVQHNQTVTDGVSTWQYAIAPDPSSADYTLADITDPLGHVREIQSEVATGFPTTEIVDKGGSGHLNLTTSYTNNGVNITRVTYPETNYDNYTYDSRGNLTEVRNVKKTGSSLSDIVTTAVYPSSCSNVVTCNKPTSITDANGNTTDYTYDSTHGGILTETGPAVGGVRPQTRYTYAAKYAWYMNAAPGPLWGTAVWNSFNWTPTYAQASAQVYVLTQTSKCMTSASCAGAAQESLATNSYVTGNSATSTNLLPSAIIAASGDGSISATTSITYDEVSNTASTTGPIAGSTVVFFYNANRRQIGLVNPDPDGAGSLKNPAIKTTYDGDGRVSEIEQGTVTSQSWSSWSSFASLTQEILGFDGTTGLKNRDTKAIGGTNQSITQYSYDSARRLSCTAIRQNSAVFGSLPSSACNQSTNSTFGPDQITQNNYDAANRLTSVVSGYNTSGVTPITTVTNVYTANSKLDYVEDANGNQSDYTYDGHDRLVQLNFPSKTSAHTPSSTDYEQYAYDDNGNRTSIRLRTTETVSFSYDALNRRTLKDIPGGTSSDVYYSYDLLGNLLYAHYGSAGGSGIDYTYDAFSRKTSETEYSRTVSSQYDSAGNRTRLTYPDSNYIQYTYDILNRMQQVQQNGSTVLAQYTYDDLSREVGISRSNSTTTTMTYGSTSQDWSKTQTGLSQNVTFGMTITPAQQIYQRSVSNTAYAYSAPSASLSYSPNGLNQYSTVGSSYYTSDGRGNLTCISSASSCGGTVTRSYTYDLENRLTGVAGSASMAISYDPLGRMQQTVASSTTEQYLYDGDRLIVEYNGSGTILRRYVPGRIVDETLIWFEGTGLSTANWLHTDQQGSTIAVSNSSGTATIYAYSVSGEPSAWGSSAPPIFRYTGQAALPAVALYYYKARMYDPALGRFLQTDPVGYDAGMNLYTYVANDPANNTDPTGNQVWRIEDTNGQCSSCVAPGATRDNHGFIDDRTNSSVLREPKHSPPTKRPPRDAIQAVPSDEQVAGFAGVAAAYLAPELKLLKVLYDLLNPTTGNTYNFTNTVEGNAATRPYINSPLTIQQIERTGQGVPDPGGLPGALRYDVPGSYNGSPGTYQLVIDPKTNTVYHFLFTGK